MKTWKYYNHAMIPTTAPHELADEAALNDCSFWKENKSALLARWTSDFDCGYETNWWYVIKDAPYRLEDVSAKERKSIHQALRKCYVRKIDFSQYKEELYICYSSAFSRYENADNMCSYEQFCKSCEISNNLIHCFAGFDAETNVLIGYITVCVYDVYVELQTAKFNPHFLNRQVSDALYHHILDYYLNHLNKKYVCSGSRNINHKTNTQDYKIRRFGYRKAYCHLHIMYNPKIKFFVKIVYLFRTFLKRLDRITLFHQINSVLKMEEIYRSGMQSK